MTIKTNLLTILALTASSGAYCAHMSNHASQQSYDAELKRALAQSREDNELQRALVASQQDNELQRAIAASMQLQQPKQQNFDAELKQVLAQSKQQHDKFTEIQNRFLSLCHMGNPEEVIPDLKRLLEQKAQVNTITEKFHSQHYLW